MIYLDSATSNPIYCSLQKDQTRIDLAGLECPYVLHPLTFIVAVTIIIIIIIITIITIITIIIIVVIIIIITILIRFFFRLSLHIGNRTCVPESNAGDDDNYDEDAHHHHIHHDEDHYDDHHHDLYTICNHKNLI